MPFLVCSTCQNLLDFIEPVGDFATRYTLCPICSQAFAQRLKGSAIQEVRVLAERLLSKKDPA